MANFVQDPWAPLSYKAPVGDGDWGAANIAAMGWAHGHGRRLNTYKILQAYLDNNARQYATTSTDADVPTANNRREYGDAALIAEQILSALLGDDQEIVIPAASDLPDNEDDQANLTPEESARLAFAQGAAKREEELRDWAIKEKLKLKMLESEGNAVGLGDGVYVLGLSRSKRRAQLRVYNPSFYFPVVMDESAGDYPTRVHIAWEVVEDNGDWIQVDSESPNPPGVKGTAQRRLRRITYEMRALNAPRPYKWTKDGEGPNPLSCFMTDAIWTLDTNAQIDDLDSEAAMYLRNEDGVEINGLDLQIDFIPVLHVPNTASFQHHFGRSCLSRVLQLLDDIQNADTDKQDASDIIGTPPIAISGAALDDEITTYGPGQVFKLGAEGQMSVMNTSGALDAISNHNDALLERLAVNSRVSEALMGRLKGQAQSGVMLALSFGPLESMIDAMRLVRDDKYPILLSMVQKLAIAGGFMDDDPQVYDATVTFGSYLPVDKTATVTHVTALMQAKAISRLTGVKMLIEAGFPISDANEEVARIEREDFDGADSLLAATGDEVAVFDYLGRDAPTNGSRPPQPPDTGTQPPIPNPIAPGTSAPSGGSSTPEPSDA